jgi:trimeric autotransporter adhesin
LASIPALSNATGSENSFFGAEAGEQGNSSGNSFFGNSTGVHNTGASNSFFGGHAGELNTTGTANTFIGYQAGDGNSSGSNNSFLGFEAGGGTNSTASDNSFLGYQAGFFETTGTRNSFFGSQAGFSNTTGSLNTFIGYGANLNGAAISNATAIGGLAQVNQSNSLVLGSIAGVNNAIADTTVGIGTSSPLGKLQVVTSNDTDPGSIFNWDSRHFVTGASGNAGGIGMSYDQNNKAGYIEALIPNLSWANLILQSGGGRIGIGTTMPSATLSVNGSADKPGGGSWSVFSDERLKDIKGAFTSGLQAVMHLQPLRYEYKSENALNLKSDGEHIGFSAQALQKVIPEAVTKNEQGYLLVNNDPIMWTMLNAIKEQQVQLETQRHQLEQQQQQIELLKNLFCLDHSNAEICKL